MPSPNLVRFAAYLLCSAAICIGASLPAISSDLALRSAPAHFVDPIWPPRDCCSVETLASMWDKMKDVNHNKTQRVYLFASMYAKKGVLAKNLGSTSAHREAIEKFAAATEKVDWGAVAAELITEIMVDVMLEVMATALPAPLRTTLTVLEAAKLIKECVDTFQVAPHSLGYFDAETKTCVVKHSRSEQPRAYDCKDNTGILRTGDICGARKEAIHPHRVVCDYQRRLQFLRYSGHKAVTEAMVKNFLERGSYAPWWRWHRTAQQHLLDQDSRAREACLRNAHVDDPRWLRDHSGFPGVVDSSEPPTGTYCKKAADKAKSYYEQRKRPCETICHDKKRYRHKKDRKEACKKCKASVKPRQDRVHDVCKRACMIAKKQMNSVEAAFEHDRIPMLNQVRRHPDMYDPSVDRVEPWECDDCHDWKCNDCKPHWWSLPLGKCKKPDDCQFDELIPNETAEQELAEVPESHLPPLQEALRMKVKGKLPS